MNEHWKQWEPIANSEGKYGIYRFCERAEGLELICRHDDLDRNMKLLFEHHVYAYTNTNETLTLQRLGAIGKQPGLISYGKWSFFTVENSNYIKRLSEQAGGLVNISNLKHFAFITSDSMTDVITSCEPKVSWIMYDLPEPESEDEDDE
jgi:hypothetical protein